MENSFLFGDLIDDLQFLLVEEFFRPIGRILLAQTCKTYYRKFRIRYPKNILSRQIVLGIGSTGSAGWLRYFHFLGWAYSVENILEVAFENAQEEFIRSFSYSTFHSDHDQFEIKSDSAFPFIEPFTIRASRLSYALGLANDSHLARLLSNVISPKLLSIHLFKGAAKRGNIDLILDLLYEDRNLSNLTTIATEIALEACRAGRVDVLELITTHGLVSFVDPDRAIKDRIRFITAREALSSSCFSGECFLRTFSFLEKIGVDLSPCEDHLVKVANWLGSPEALAFLQKKFNILDDIIVPKDTTDAQYAVLVLDRVRQQQFDLARYLLENRGSRDVLSRLDIIYDRIFEKFVKTWTDERISHLLKFIPFLTSIGLRPNRGCLFRLEAEKEAELSTYQMSPEAMKLFELLLDEKVYIKPRLVSLVVKYCRQPDRLERFLKGYVELELGKITADVQLIFYACLDKSIPEIMRFFEILQPFKKTLPRDFQEKLEEKLWSLDGEERQAILDLFD